jgi:hypothetical protein
MVGCGSTSGPIDDLQGKSWALAVQPGQVNGSYVLTPGKPRVILPACAADSDLELPVLSRSGRAIALVGCWAGNDYAVVTIVNGNMQTSNVPANLAEWTSDQALLLAQDDKLLLLDTATRKMDTLGLDSPGGLRAMAASPSGEKVLLISGGRPESGTGGIPDQGDLVGTKVRILEVANRQIHNVTAPDTTRNAFWSPDGSKLALETDHEWLVLDPGSDKVVERHPRPSENEKQGNSVVQRSCRLSAFGKRGLVGWCATSRRLIEEAADGRQSVILRLPGADVGSQVSLAPEVGGW